MWHKLVSEDDVHLFEGLALGPNTNASAMPLAKRIRGNILREEENIAESRTQVEDKEGVEESKANGIKCKGRDLTNHETYAPVCQS
jgi:hypothetical protein